MANGPTLSTWCIVLISCLYQYVSSMQTPEFPLAIINQSTVISNEYETDSDSYWRSTSYFTPIQNATYSSITLKQSFYMEFDLIWHGQSKKHQHHIYRTSFRGIIRIGIPSNDVYSCQGHATRYPALYLDTKHQALQFSISDDRDCWGVGLLNTTYHNLQINTKYSITIQYNQTWAMIKVNDQILYNDKRAGSTPDDMLYEPVSIMISDILDPPANVTLSNILILSYDDIFSLHPTISPTETPTVAIPNVAPLPTTNDVGSTAILNDNDNVNTSYIVKIVVVASYDYHVIPNNDTLNDSVIGAMIMDIFATFDNNLSNLTININEQEKDISIDVDISVESEEKLNRLIAYVNMNLSADIISGVEDKYTNTYIVDIDCQIEIEEKDNINTNLYDISDDSDNQDTNNFFSWFSTNTKTVVYMIVIVTTLCLCSFMVCIYVLYRYHTLKNKMKTMEENEKIYKAESLKQRGIIKKLSFEDGEQCRTGTILACMDTDNPMATDQAMEELQQLSHSKYETTLTTSSRTRNPVYVSPEELSLGTPGLITSSEGMDKSLFYPDLSIQRYYPQENDDVFSISGNLNQIPHDKRFVLPLPAQRPSLRNRYSVYSQSDRNSNNSNNAKVARGNMNNLDMLIEDQRKITNTYSSRSMNYNIQSREDDLDIDDVVDDADENGEMIELYSPSLSDSGHEAMYDEGHRVSMHTKKGIK